MNKNTTYRIAQFAIYKLDRQSWVLQTTERINIITNSALVHFLKEIMYQRYITSDKLLHMKQKYEDIFDNIIKYIQDNEILIPLKELNFRDRKIVCVRMNNSLN